MSIVDDFRITLAGKEYVPIMQGGMGVDISTSELALAIAREGGIGHISDAMGPYVSDRKFGTKLQSSKQKEYKEFANSLDKSTVKWFHDRVYEGTLNHVRSTMEAKRGPGAVYVNIMEKLTMGNPKETLRARIMASMDAGVDGITLSAGLHKGTLGIIDDLPRFRDCQIGIIVSSVRALKIFLRSASRVNRLPDYVVVEGPLAGGHLGFGDDWAEHDLKTIVKDVIDFLKKEELNLPVIPAGGVFTGTDAVEFLQMGAGAVQVATRFTVSKECGYPDKVKQIYLRSNESDVEVNYTSPTGYPMRMLKSSPSLRSNIRPNCEALGYILDKDGKCQYHQAWDEAPLNEKGKKMPVTSKMCICYHFMKYDCYTCGHNVYRLSDTTVETGNGEYYLPTATHIFNDYRYSKDHNILLPEIPGSSEGNGSGSDSDGDGSSAENTDAKNTAVDKPSGRSALSVTY